MVLGYFMWPTATAGKKPELLLTIGSKGSGPGQFANSCWSIACRGDEVIVCAPYRISVFDRDGKFLRPFTKERIWASARSIAMSAAGDVFVVDVHAVAVFRQDGTFVREMLGRPHDPFCVAVDSKQELLFTTNGFRHCVEVFTLEGRLVRKFGSEGSGDGQLFMPRGVAVNAEVAVGDMNSQVQVCSMCKSCCNCL